jgi:hypothetical protein
MTVILMPHAEGHPASEVTLSPRLASLRGATVGFVNNSWRCMDLLSDELQALLRDRYGVVEIIEERISAAQTLPEDRLTAMAARCDAVIVGIGN